jgi:hypothetical protein
MLTSIKLPIFLSNNREKFVIYANVILFLPIFANLINFSRFIHWRPNAYVLLLASLLLRASLLLLASLVLLSL